MNTNGVPNDLLGSFNSLTIIVCTPLLSHVLYPLLNRYKIRFGRISRITFGFLLATLSGVIGAIVQYYVYQTSPCGYQASSCDGVSPISIWWQLPNVMLGAISELFCNVTAYELAYARAPPNMKSVVMSMFLFNTALSSALAEILIPAIVDPYLVVSSPQNDWALDLPRKTHMMQSLIRGDTVGVGRTRHRAFRTNCDFLVAAPRCERGRVHDVRGAHHSCSAGSGGSRERQARYPSGSGQREEGDRSLTCTLYAVVIAQSGGDTRLALVILC